jgi:hypothetical protein
MNSNAKDLKFVAVGLLSGLLLATISKLLYDLFNGYAVVPNFLIDIGLLPSWILLETMQFIGIAGLAFCAGHVLFKIIQEAPATVAIATAAPWVVLCLWGVISSLVSEHRNVVLGGNKSYVLLLSPAILMITAVPVGVWLAYRGKRTDA